MNNSITLFLCLLVMLFTTSCEKETFIDIEPANHIIETRSSGEYCTTCEAIDVSLQKLSTEDDCVTSILTITLNEPDCDASTRHMVYMGEELLTFFTSRTLDVEIEYCEDEEKILTVMGYNPEDEKWNSTCFKSVFKSNDTKAQKAEVTYDELVQR